MTIDGSIVFTFSPERKKRDLADLEAQIAKAQTAVREKSLMGNPYGTGWRSLVATEKEAAVGKKDKNLYRAVALKQSVIDERRKIAGYSALVFAHPQDLPQQERLSDEQILGVYHKLVSIEECFRIMKSNFSIRPMYLRLKERITAHCYLCVIALMLLKSLQLKLAARGAALSTSRITSALFNAVIAPIPVKGSSELTFMSINLGEKFYGLDQLHKNRHAEHREITEDFDDIWAQYHKRRSSVPDDIDLILSAVGLEPLQTFNTLGQIRRALGLSGFCNEVMLSSPVKRYLEQLSKNL